MGRRAAQRHTAAMHSSAETRHAMDVFLVEDSSQVVERLQEMLGAIQGVRTVGSAARADDAIRDVLTLRPDAVLCDIGLAQGTGFDVLRALHEQAPGIEVFMLSNFATEPYRRLAARLGARDFFDKSTELGRMRDAVAARAAAQH
jgi:two-component system, NarL family, response regulator DevR